MQYAIGLACNVDQDLGHLSQGNLRSDSIISILHQFQSSHTMTVVNKQVAIVTGELLILSSKTPQL
jgi:hypothetical protein